MLNEEVPQMLKNIEAQLREHCPEFVIIALHKEKYWRSFSSEASAHGMMVMQLGDIESGWDSERHDKFHDEDID
ncbi:MAG: hypothetical protein ACHQ1D_00730 [Nitrososphaerales archaeon]